VLLECQKIRAVKRLISLIALFVQLICFKLHVNHGFNARFVTFFDLFVFDLPVNVIGPLLLNASLLLVLTTY